MIEPLSESAKVNRETVARRLAEDSDEDFLAAVYADARRAELAMFGWSRGQEDAFFKMQFGLQKQAYRMQFPGAAHYVVELDETPIGRLIVYSDENEIRLVDVALLAAYRNRGIGGILLEELKTEASFDKSLNLRVLKTNSAAKRFYERHGFSIVEEADLHFSMRWRKS